MEDKESQLKLGDVHIVLGDVSLESENFELAVQVPFILMVGFPEGM